MTTTCEPCEDVTCMCPVPECLTTLRLGTITLLNTQVYVHVVKNNGAEYIHPVTSNGSGLVDIPLTNPDKQFYNHFDGEYKIFVMSGGYFCEGERLTVTSPGSPITGWTTAGVTFRKADGVSYTTGHLVVS